MHLSIRDVLLKVFSFVVLNPFGSRADFDSFRPIKVEFDEKSGNWVVVCVFRRGKEEVRARVMVSDENGEIVGYEELGV